MKRTYPLTYNIREKEKRESLQRTINRKKDVLIAITSRFELLRMELDQIKREYFFRVGNLIDRDNKLDIDLITHKNILSLMKNGLTYKQALEKINNEYNQQNEEQFFYDEEEFMKRANSEKIESSNGVYDEQKYKQLWKKAVMKFHPDLTSDPEEKNIREEIMKKINQAYTEHDYDVLQDIYENTQVKPSKDITTEDLERMLVEIENKIIQTRKEYTELKKTEWFQWKKKIRIAKRSGIDVFREMENSLLDDIVRKMRLLSEIKQEIGHI